MNVANSTYSAMGLRRSVLPIEHLEAELLTAPFANDTAFAGALIALDPSLPQAMVPLWRQTERDLLCRFPGMSIDELISRRDRAWFGHSGRQTPVPLGEMLGRAMRELISVDASRARPLVKPDSSEVAQRHFWRWLTFSIPADLLLAAAGAGSDHLEFVSARLRHQLEVSGLAEPHLHLRAALDFPTLWSSLMRSLARPDATTNMLESPGAEWDEGRGLAPLLLRCALARLLMAAFLREPDLHTAGFHDFLNSHAAPRLNSRFGASTCLPLWQTVISLAAGRIETPYSFAMLRELYAQLIGPSNPSQPIAKLDPLSWWMPSLPESRPDFWLTRTGLTYLSRDGAYDTLFAQVFWQTQRGKVLFYRHVVQRPMVAGLQWFTRTYARLSRPRKAVPQTEFIHQAVKLSGPGLRALEVRVTPEDRLSDLVKLIKDLDEAANKLSSLAPASPIPEMGLIFHFSRDRGEEAQKGRPSAWSRGGHDDPEAVKHKPNIRAVKLNPSGYRFSTYYREQRTGAMTLANLLIAYPRMLERVRGIDLCTDELAVPFWVLLPLVRHVMGAANRAAAYLQQIGLPAQPSLRVTVHAGEDFVHLLGGIRRVDEAVELLELGEGSRIGHAVALGVDVHEWAARVGRLVLPKGERLLDLLWAWRVARRIPEDLRSWLPWIEQELSRLSVELFGHSHTAAILNQWWESLHMTEGLRSAGFPDGPPPWAWNNETGSSSGSDRLVQDMLYRWLSDSALFRRAQSLETIDASREAPLIIALQAHVRKVIGARGITVEINPSSNLLIGHLCDLTSHPLWRLCPPAGIDSDAPNVRVCIGSDDPITFVTSLPEEYQLLADALTRAGVAGPDVDAWLEAARHCGLTTKFTVPRLDGELDKLMCADMPPPPL